MRRERSGRAAGRRRHRVVPHPGRHSHARDFSYRPGDPQYLPQNCTGCMDCVTQCPDTAILGKVLSEAVEQKLQSIADDDERAMFEQQWSQARASITMRRRRKARTAGGSRS